MILDTFLRDVRRTVLPNGLTLLSRPGRGRGVVAIDCWVKAGYFHEPDEVAGMAHLFEHMFFKGSKNFPGAEDIARHVSMLGGVSNAGTIYDSTNYYFVLPREGFARGVEIQADAILNPLFDPVELIKEAEVVVEESNRKLDNAAAVATERMYATAFTKHRMRRWRIGSNEVLRNVRRDDLVAFFETLYRPSNIVLTITGDVSHEEALETVERTFGQIPAGRLVKNRGPAEPPQEAFRFAQGTADIGQSYSVLGWHTAGEGHEDVEALELLAAVLATGRCSRLYRGVVSAGAANSASADNTVFEDAGIFTVRLSFDDASAEDAERATIREVERLRHFGPTRFELDRARNGIESAFVFELEDVLGQAQTLAFFEARGGYAELARHLEKLERVTADDVRRVAVEYLTETNLTLYRYRRTGTPEPRPEFVLAQLREAAAGAGSADHADVTPPSPRPEPRPSPASVTLRRFLLPNGIPLFVRTLPGTPTVSTGVYFRGGKTRETSANAGITQLMTRAMKRGTRRRSMEEIDREIEFLGTQIGILFDDDYFGVSLDILRKRFPAGIDLLAETLLEPAFPSEEVEKAKKLQIAAIRRSLDSSSARPIQLFRAAFYRNHPYAFPDAGFISTVDALGRDELVAWHDATVRADSALIVVAGDVDPDDVFTIASARFGTLPPSTALRPAVPAFEPVGAPTEISELRDRRQSAIVAGFPTVTPTHPDWVTLRVLQDVVSGLSGTLFAELRGKRSLAYTVYAGDASHELAGAFVGYIASDASKEQEAREALVAEMRRFATDGFDDDDVARGRAHLAGTTRIRLQTNSAIRSEIAENYLFGLGTDFTERFLERVHGVGVDELRDVARRYLLGDNFVVATMRGRA
ncbi:MAG: insulinase family protein [Thermoanaerobaculia bacterium]|nr:insulinase family protein [Thermoanaerobaculia bacterium]